MRLELDHVPPEFAGFWWTWSRSAPSRLTYSHTHTLSHSHTHTSSLSHTLTLSHYGQVFGGPGRALPLLLAPLRDPLGNPPPFHLIQIGLIHLL